jgi:hypothetical protein
MDAENNGRKVTTIPHMDILSRKTEKGIWNLFKNQNGFFLFAIT